MVFIDQVAGEIIVSNVCVLTCVLCKLEKTWINRLQTYKQLNYINYILNRGCPHKPKAK